ncbi:hypothetical protein PIB30_094013 [Stylosanthes scabra]|uniref:Uncharacterized protein n=1 Tax=Stylosanthes scabra TaxID=79078 RepID=A0ABU6YVV9_9FABA|nr:hypothetical protein [Stylosanthes scabra]
MSPNHTIKGGDHPRVALPATPNYSSGEALFGFRQVASVTSEPSTSGLKYHPNIGAVCGDTHSALAMANHQQEQTNTNPPSGTSGMNIPPKTPNQPLNIGGREMNDGQEASVTPDCENLDFDSGQAGRKIGNSRRPVFVALCGQADRRRKCLNSGLSKPQFQGTLPTKKVTIQGKEKEPYPLFPKSFTKPTDVGYDGSTDPEDHLDAFKGRMNCECAGDTMRCKAFPVSLAGQAMC